MSKANYLATLLIFLLLLGCEEKEPSITTTFSNPSEIKRTQETVSIPASQLSSLLTGHELDDILVRDEGTKTYLVVQWIDYDQDGAPEELLFQVDLDANQSKEFSILWKESGKAEQPKSTLTTYSRFVPERTDDYTWENDKVAFRTYGPEAQRLVEEGLEGGTLSSGIDLWLKKVDYSIIDSWYEKNAKEQGYYHIEHGEGHDPYHVGKSRGTGGSGVWLEDSLHISKNFVSYRTLATGPIRTVFELDYAPWSKYGIQEKKRISLDLGSNFSKYEITLSSEQALPNYAVGITLHEGAGEVLENKEEAWFGHWEPMGDSFVGEGILVAPKDYQNHFTNYSVVPDQSQLLILLRSNPSLTYYAGFAWTASGDVSDKGDWEEMLQYKAKVLANPLEVTFGK
ncbi:DUF4861 domain-containing protein [Algoriphagus jejuensis]|uniref:DUF4861 domain-containing protein n=1 Tax=Algoriphagus jejuensis TaxID=419934 RepID=A0ABP3YAY0_9BACT